VKGRAREEAMSRPGIWDADLAFERARMAYRYVAATFPESSDLEVLAPYTAAAHEAERDGDMEAFEDALRSLMRAAKAEAMRERAEAA
jgi:hypothetical protein